MNFTNPVWNSTELSLNGTVFYDVIMDWNPTFGETNTTTNMTRSQLTIAGISTILTSIVGLIFNVSIFILFLSRKKLSNGFYVLCLSKSISNSFVLLFSLCWIGPAILLNHLFLPLEINKLLGQLNEYGFYLIGPFTQFLMAVDRFLIIVYPMRISDYARCRISALAIFICWISCMTFVATTYTDNCWVYFSLSKLNYTSENEACDEINLLILRAMCYFLGGSSVLLQVSNLVSLLLLHTLCSTPNSGCRYVEVKTGKNRWEKRTAILVRPDESDQIIYIYTYFLKGIGAGKPLIGQVFPLKDLKTCEAKREKSGAIVMKLATDKQKITFKASGNEAGLWVAAVMSCTQATLTHETHGPINDGSVSNAVPNIKDEPENANYTGSREGYVMPVQEGSLSEEKKKKKEEEKNQNDPPKDPAQKSDEKKPESAKNLTKVASKTKTKDSTTTESGRKKKKKDGVQAATQALEGAAAKPDDPVAPVHKTDSEPDNNCDPQLKKTQTETQETSGKGNGETPNKLVTPISTTPAGAASLTPTPGLNADAKDDQKVKTLTNSDENEAPEKKKS